jgi:hypothetical protein
MFIFFSICRPGSVVGPQQQYLVSVEQMLFREGALYREKNIKNGATANLHGSSPTTVPVMGEKVRSGFSMSNGSVATTLASESGEYSLRSTPSIIQSQVKSQQQQSGAFSQCFSSFRLSLFLIHLLYREYFQVQTCR